jgi:hypothetical protein
MLAAIPLRTQAITATPSRQTTMKKLKLEELEISSFETLPSAPEARGTLKGHQIQLTPSRLRPCYPTDPNFDCTWTCSHGSDCPDYCID